MRVTQSMMTRNYLKSLNTASYNLAKSNQKLASGRKYGRLSENVSDCSKVLKLREDYYKNEQYLNNIKAADNELSACEGNMKAMTEVLQTAQERITKGLNGTMSESDREAIAREFKGLQDQVLKTANAQFGDKYLFSGSNNQSPPFTIGTTGEVLYNGVDVSKIYMNNGKYYTPAPVAGDPPVLVPQNEKTYIDIGLGIKMSGSNVDPTTAFETTFSGLDVIGFGVNTAGQSKNVIGLLGEIASELSKPDGTFKKSAVEDAMMLLKEQTDYVVVNMTEVGTRSNFLERTSERIENDLLNIEGLRARLEGTDDATEVTNMKMFEYAWMATLKIGSQIIPPSLMDFIS